MREREAARDSHRSASSRFPSRERWIPSVVRGESPRESFRLFICS